MRNWFLKKLVKFNISKKKFLTLKNDQHYWSGPGPPGPGPGPELGPEPGPEPSP